MDIGTAMDIMRASIYELTILGAPLLLIPLAVGLIISILQATTQIQEQTLTFVPKIISIFAVLILLGPWILTRLVNFVNYIMGLMPSMVK